VNRGEIVSVHTSSTERRLAQSPCSRSYYEPIYSRSRVRDGYLPVCSCPHLSVRQSAVAHVYEMTSRLDEGKHFLGELREHWEVREVPASAAPQLPHVQQPPQPQQPQGSWRDGPAPPASPSVGYPVSGAPGRGTATEGQVRDSQFSRAPASVVVPASGPSLVSQSGFQLHPHHHVECPAGAGGPGGSPTRARPGTVKLGATLLEHHLLWHWCLLDIGSGDAQHALTRYDNSMAARGVSRGARSRVLNAGCRSGPGLQLPWGAVAVR
jgi:hypothetical protein